MSLEDGCNVFALEVACDRAPAVELGEQLGDRLIRPEIDSRRLTYRRMVEPVGIAKHSGREDAHGLDRVRGVAKLGERHQESARLPHIPGELEAAQPDVGQGVLATQL